MDSSLIQASELRNQFNGLFMLQEARAPKPDGVIPLGMTVSNPPTQSEVQGVADKLDELINALNS